MEQESTTPHAKGTAERLDLIKSVHAKRLARQNQNTESDETNNEDIDITVTRRTEPKPTRDASSGQKEITTAPASNGIPGTKESRAPSESSNLPAASDKIPSTELKQHLEILTEGSSEFMNLLDSTNSHLHDLMLSLKKDHEENEEDKPWKANKTDTVNQTIGVARQLQNTMRLKLDAVKTLHKMHMDLKEK